jgi:hypothetical protein
MYNGSTVAHDSGRIAHEFLVRSDHVLLVCTTAMPTAAPSCEWPLQGCAQTYDSNVLLLPLLLLPPPLLLLLLL